MRRQDALINLVSHVFLSSCLSFSLISHNAEEELTLWVLLWVLPVRWQEYIHTTCSVWKVWKCCSHSRCSSACNDIIVAFGALVRWYLIPVRARGLTFSDTFTVRNKGRICDGARFSGNLKQDWASKFSQQNFPDSFEDVTEMTKRGGRVTSVQEETRSRLWKSVAVVWNLWAVS